MGEVNSQDFDNPLLAWGGLPAFDRIEAHHVVPAMRRLLPELQSEVETLEAALVSSWEGAVEPLERLNDRLGFSWGAVGHLMGVKNSDALRAAHDEVLGDVVAFGLRLAQSRPLYEALLALREGAGWSSLEPARQRIVESLLRDARHAGVGLEGAAPSSWRELTAQSAREEAGEADATAGDGPWRVTLDPPSFFPYMEHGRRSDLRETLYRAYVSRASEGELDNAPIISQMLALRREEALLLGYASFAELSLASKMAPDVAAVETLLEDLREVSYAAAQRDLEDLQRFAEQQDPEADTLRHWDLAFWAERLREHRFDYSEEELRPYFPLPEVLEGLFALAQRLFGVTIDAADGEASVWHPDVRFFRVRDEGGSPIAAFFLDPYSRPQEKRGGAWMDECVGRSRLLGDADEAVRLPVAYLVCNQMPPIEGKPSLMSFAEVTTLFHEFGHGLQHMLTQVELGLAAGIRNVEWDAVELPSQFMENWCYQRATLQELSGHFETGEALPDALFDKLDAARTYRAGSSMLRQLYFSSTDLELHSRYDPGAGEDAFEVQRRVARKTTVLPPLPEDRFLCAFGHIFAGGYAAGYYSYKWAEVLSADAFAAFEEAGLDDSEAVIATGRRFRDTVLALGGSLSPMEVFRAFRGRDPRVEALLRHSGLTGQAA